MNNINLKGNPFYLNDEQIKWVEDTRASLTEDEKLGQLMFTLGMSKEEADIDEMFNVFMPGGMMYRPAPGEEVVQAHRILQSKSKIPMFLAANLEQGGNGLVTEGTRFGNSMIVAATGDEENARRLGMVCAREAEAVGGNTAFAPVIDLNYNFRNPITNTRSFGDDAKLVAKMGAAYVEGMQNTTDSIVTIKHFPGDGCDGRDQHLITTVNNLSVEDWKATFGHVYSESIKVGAKGLMVGHIAFPSYIKEKNPNGEVSPMIPASLSSDLLNGLLREELGYNGLVVTDASLMTGFTQYGKRKDIVPMSIAAGCDMFLFTKCYKEDFKFMKQGYENGVITPERLDEAVTRILATKASINLHESKDLVPGNLEVLGCDEHKEWAKEVADQAITLVRDDQEMLPLSADKTKKIGMYVFNNEEVGPNKSHELFIEKLEARGFEIHEIDYSNPQEAFAHFGESVESLQDRFDAIIIYNCVGPMSNVTNLSVPYRGLLGLDAPWYINEVPTMMVSVASPYHDYDMGMVPTAINAYMSSEAVIDSLISKMMGECEFKGKSPVNLDIQEFAGDVSRFNRESSNEEIQIPVKEVAKEVEVAAEVE